jgi:hypothetical protein
MKLQAIGVLATALVAAVPAIAEPSPDIFQIVRAFSVGAGESFGSVFFATVPINKRMVVQSVSLFRNSARPTSTTQGALNVSIFGYGSTIPMLAVSPGLVGITTNTTVYVGAGDSLAYTVYRFGDLSGDEFETVTISGYYVDKPEKAPLP